MTDLCHLPAHELVQRMAAGSVSCREVVEAHLARIEAVNPRLNALVVATDPQLCLQRADEADGRVARGEPVGRLHGVPVVVKDVIKVSGLACSGGAEPLRAVASDDATVVSRLRAEGAIVLGLTNVPEMGRGGESNNNLYGRTNNPFDLSRTPGGSSGGSAALVCAGGAALSVGSDGGGSIRQPSTTPASPDSNPPTAGFPGRDRCSGTPRVSSDPSIAMARWLVRLRTCFSPVGHERTGSARPLRRAWASRQS